jgi:hypothetical protein|tara:strand:+ start:93 stop:440 length:348 start_codon:yes stop_codon:yes gene_type:complete
MNKTNYLWFAESDVETTADALMVRADSYLGADPVSGGINLKFEDLQGHQTVETVKLHCANGNQKAVLVSLAAIMNAHPHAGGKMITVIDMNVANGQIALGAHDEFGGLVTDVTIT